jgi:hypothetical protein
MSDENRKPGADELSDEEMKDVAGGMFPATTKTGGASLSGPDICKTPAAPSPVPIPYPNVTGIGDDTATKVNADGNPVETKGDGA